MISGPIITTALLCISVAMPALAQEQPDCASPDAALHDDCRSVSLSTSRPKQEPGSTESPNLNLSRDIPWDSSSQNAQWGQTASFGEKETPSEPIWMDPDRDQVTKAILYVPPSSKSPIVRTTYSDGSMKERSPIVDELRLWTRARKQNESLELLDVTEQVRNPVVVPPDESILRFKRIPTPPLDSNGTVFKLEKETEPDTKSKEKGGPDCVERTDPDGSYSKQCSQSWNWTSSN